jgi:hypothetical protein
MFEWEYCQMGEETFYVFKTFTLSYLFADLQVHLPGIGSSATEKDQAILFHRCIPKSRLASKKRQTTQGS